MKIYFRDIFKFVSANFILYHLGDMSGKNETTYEFFKSKDYPYDYITAVRSQKSAKVIYFT